MNDKFDDFEYISIYSRAQALADGVLMECDQLAKEADFRYPTALTSAVWNECVAVPTSADWQDETGRLWDILHMLRIALLSAGQVTTVAFTVLVQNDEEPAQPVNLKAVCGPGDNGEPVITVMFPDED